MIVTAGSGLPTPIRLRSENGGFVNGENTDCRSKEARQPVEHPCFLPQISRRKPTWLVRTESNVRKAARKKADPPCVECKGSGRADCFSCSGTGRRNCVNLAVLPKGEWPKWCESCRGSGMYYCFRCMGTGEHKDDAWNSTS